MLLLLFPRSAYQLKGILGMITSLRRDEGETEAERVVLVVGDAVKPERRTAHSSGIAPAAATEYAI